MDFKVAARGLKLLTLVAVSQAAALSDDVDGTKESCLISFVGKVLWLCEGAFRVLTLEVVSEEEAEASTLWDGTGLSIFFLFAAGNESVFGKGCFLTGREVFATFGPPAGLSEPEGAAEMPFACGGFRLCPVLWIFEGRLAVFRRPDTGGFNAEAASPVALKLKQFGISVVC